MDSGNSTTIDHMDHAKLCHDSFPARGELGACKATLDFTERCVKNIARQDSLNTSMCGCRH